MSKSSFFQRKKRVFLTQEDSTRFRSKTPQALNFIPPEQDLSKVKKKYDQARSENIKKAQYLDWLKGKLFEVKSSANCIQSDMSKYNTRFGEIENEIERSTSQLSQEFETRKIYDHMLIRNKNEGTHLSLVVHKFSQDLKNAKHQLDFESSKAIKMKEKKYSLKAMKKELRKALSEDDYRHKQQVSLLEKTIEQQKGMSKISEFKRKRHADILELAAKNSKDVHEKKLRENINVNKIIYDLLKEKEMWYKNAGQGIETAFRDIRIKTGFCDSKEILKKFLMKDQNQNRLIESVEHSESKLESLKKEYSVVKKQLKDAMLFLESQEEDATGISIKKARKKLEKIRDQEKKSSSAFEIAEKWGRRICEKLEIEHCESFEENVDKITGKILEKTEKAGVNFDE